MDKQTLDRLVQKFFNDPDFHFVVDMLSDKVRTKRDIATIDIKLDAETIKAIVSGRQETIELVDEFIKDVEVAKNINSNKPTSFK